MKFRMLYEERDADQRQGIVFEEPSLTDQSEAEACDINTIVRRYNQTGLLTSPGAVDPSYLQFGDATLLPDYQTALDMVRGVEEEFYSLPSNVREVFGHDPANLLAALGDPSKKEQLVSLGLIEGEKQPLSTVENNAAKAAEPQPVFKEPNQ